MKKIIYYLASFLILLILCLLSVSLGGFWSGFPEMLFMLSLSLFLTSIIFFIADIFRKTRYGLNIFIISLVCAAAFFASFKIVNIQIESSKVTAMQITEALNKYNSDNKKYPESLKEISPAYLKDLPGTNIGLIGSSFNYRRQADDDKYWLSFSEMSGDKWIYIEGRKLWALDD